MGIDDGTASQEGALLQKQLAVAGYAIVRRDAADRRGLRAILAALHPSRVERSRLRARTHATATPNTLSSRFGFAAFPPHTDYVHRSVPPRFLVLVASTPRDEGTDILDAAVLLGRKRTMMTRALFRVAATRRPFVAPLVHVDPRRAWVRYNPALMRPVTEDARAALREVDTLPHLVTIDWRTTTIAVIDNWRCLHARPAIRNYSPSSTLHRFAVWTDA